ncbi:MAG: hypothetical protein HKL82_03965 [Acidimicrobiaceae bacterium]|nr:hypothetical protein [Acidimicrobiaceae bacterium]
MTYLSALRVHPDRFLVAFFAPLLLAACGGVSNSSTATSSVSTNSSLTPTTAAITSSTGGASGYFNLAQLESLANYSFISKVGAGAAIVSFSGRIHSSTNFVISFGDTKTYFVGGQAYEVLGSLSPQKLTLNPGYFQSQGEIAAAETFDGLTRAYGIKVTKGGGCSVAGIAGTIYKESTPSNGGLVTIAQQGCVANKGGALLSFEEGAGGSAVPGGGHSYTFQVTGVNNVGALALP